MLFLINKMLISCRSVVTLFVLGIFFILWPGVISDDGGTNDTYITNMHRLHLQLFKINDKMVHANDWQTQRISVRAFLKIWFVDIDEFNGKMTVTGWLARGWFNGNRTWSPELFGNITHLQIRSSEIWKPDISLLNSAGSEGNYMVDNLVCLYSNGYSNWWPPVVYTVYCNLNLRLWPFDKQTCKLTIGSWTMINIDFNHTKDFYLNYEKLQNSTEWKIVDARVECGTKDFYNYIEYTLELQRRSSMYSAVILTPASCIIILCLSTFWLPSQMGAKILLNGVLIVIVVAFLIYFAQMLPILAKNTPLVVLFYSSSLLMLSLSTITSVIVLYLSTAKHKKRVPVFLKNLLNGVAGRALLLSQFILEHEPQSLLNNSGAHVYHNPDQCDTPDPSHGSPVPTHSSRSVQFDWALLATAFDRICFLIYCVLFIILSIAYSI